MSLQKEELIAKLDKISLLYDKTESIRSEMDDFTPVDNYERKITMRAREAEARSRELQERERIRKEEYRAHMDKVEQERKLRDKGNKQCQACAHAGRCSMTIHNNNGACTGFTPR